MKPAPWRKMKLLIELTDEQANVLFSEATADYSAAEIERAEHGERRRELIRQAILRRMPGGKASG